VDANGTIRVVAGSGNYAFGDVPENIPATSANLTNPLDVCADGSGGFVFTDTANCCLRRVFGGNRSIVTLAGRCGRCIYFTTGNLSDAVFMEASRATDATFGSLVGVTPDMSGGYFTADQVSGCIVQVLVSGIVRTAAGNCTRGAINYITFNGAPGSARAIGEGGPGTSMTFGYLYGVSSDGAGGCYFVDAYNVFRLFMNGTVLRAAGSGFFGFSGDGGPATAAQLSNPRAVAWDSSAYSVGRSDGFFIVRELIIARLFFN
jgi:trimeric autotransporter adhesin